MSVLMWICERCGTGDNGTGLCEYCIGADKSNLLNASSMEYKTFFYGCDGFVMEKYIYDLQPNGLHQTYKLRQWRRDGDVLQAVDRTFRLIRAFDIHNEHIAYYEEICGG